jgi:glycosyltransferase involved in cell wall biosynthesis
MVTHEHGRFVEEALRSALSQTIPPQQIVVVDDGSTDETLNVVRALDEPSIEIVERPHTGLSGLSETYNAGLSRCSGKMIGILEGDDRWPPDRLQRQVPFATSGAVLVHGLYRVIGARGAVLHPGVAPAPKLPEGLYDAMPHLLQGSYIMAVTTLIDRSALEAAGGFRQLSGTPHWDHPTFLAVAERGPFAFVDQPLGDWRRHGRSAVYRLAGRDLAGIEHSLALALATRARLARPGLPSAGAIRAAWNVAYAEMIWQNARVLLVERRFREARELIAGALRRPAPPTQRARQALAFAGGLLHRDVEGIASLMRGGTVLGELD